MDWMVKALRSWGRLAEHFGAERIKRVATVDPEYLMTAGADALQVGGVLVQPDGRISGFDTDDVRVYIGFSTDLPFAEVADDAVTYLTLIRELRRFLNARENCDLGGEMDAFAGDEPIALGSIQANRRVRVLAAIEARYTLRVEKLTQER